MAYVRKLKHQSLRVSLTDEEYRQVKEAYGASSCRSISEYVRKLMFRKRITVFYRNRAFDEFIEESIRLRKALAVFCGQGGFDERGKENLLQKVEDIKLIVIKISETCSQK